MDLGGKRVLVTGGSGFLGRRLLAALEGEGCAAVLAPTHAHYDLVERGAVEGMYRELKPDLVFHLAARVGGIAANQRNPAVFFHDNLLMGVHVIEEGRRAGVGKIVITGTVCAYPKFTPAPFKEDDLWNGYPEETNAPYGVAKKALLVMAQAYREQYGLNAIMLFPVNLYGPGDNFDLETSHVIAAMIRKCIEAREAGSPNITLWGDGSPTREFLHVDDCARALILAARGYDAPDPVNVGTGTETSIADLAAQIMRLTRYDGEVRWDRERPNGQPRRVLDTSRARGAFGFGAEIGLEEGLKGTIEWYLAEREQAGG